ncbi:DUF3299 domain-containing protein [bacterium]|nr:DUF3299 domain-containing protein [bacterium]
MLSTIGFALGFAGIYAYINRGATDLAASASPDAKPASIDWATLRELDLSTGKASEQLKKVDGQRVKIPGFMIPLEDNQNAVTEFLLVPSPMACIHVPPPPANQMVHVKMTGGRKAAMSFGPIWIQGRLRISDVSGPYGKSSFEIVGELTEPYQ